MEFELGKVFPNLVFKEVFEDEYTDEKGYPYCKNCKTPRFFQFESNGKIILMRGKCKCQSEEIKRREDEEKKRIAIAEFRARQKGSAIGEKYLEARFSTATITKNNKQAYVKCINYSKNAREVLKEGIGLYVYGDNSSGKSHLLACLCNDLVEQGFRCFYTSVPKMIAEIQNSYADDSAMGQARLVNMLSKMHFVFIDDLGKEFLGREYNSSLSKFTEKVLLEVLNAIYNNGNCVIFSSNYSIPELVESFSLDKAIIERINEMATRVIKLEGDDFRDKIRKEKSEIAKKLGI